MRGGSGLFVQISQETTSGGGSKGVKSVMEQEDHPACLVFSKGTKGGEPTGPWQLKVSNLRSHGNRRKHHFRDGANIFATMQERKDKQDNIYFG